MGQKQVVIQFRFLIFSLWQIGAAALLLLVLWDLHMKIRISQASVFGTKTVHFFFFFPPQASSGHIV